MFGSKIVAALLFSLLGCARPNYQEIAPISIQKNDGQQKDDGQTTKTCNLVLSTQNICVDISWEKAPTESDMGSFLLKFFDVNAQEHLVDPTHSVAVVLWMPSMGHGSSPVKIQKISEGKYLITNVYFIMSGDWDIRIQLKDGSNVIDQVIQKISI